MYRVAVIEIAISPKSSFDPIFCKYNMHLHKMPLQRGCENDIWPEVRMFS